ncbi:hypothetical protein [Thermodesulfovibrio sp.]|uniref:hypothetical protein n=1 Tax=Thermodesulfovibrio sp. TaxID=2067987 RepID=UPI0030B48753
MPKALLCENNLEVQKNFSAILKAINIDVVTSSTVDEAMNNLEIEDFAYVIVNENFAGEKPESNKIIQFVVNLPMYRRRDMMLIILGQNLKTSDRLSAFAKGANLLLNLKDLNYFLPIFKRTYLEYQAIYKQFKELLNK